MLEGIGCLILSVNKYVASLRRRLQLLLADTEKHLSGRNYHVLTAGKKGFVRAIEVELAGVNQEKYCGCTWYFRESTESSVQVFTNEETSMGHFSIGRLKN